MNIQTHCHTKSNLAAPGKDSCYTSFVKIIFSGHALRDKFPILKKRGFDLNKQQVLSVIKKPDHTDRISDYPKVIASGSLDEKHILRVVYKLDNGIIKVITFYPAEKGRYYL